MVAEHACLSLLRLSAATMSIAAVGALDNGLAVTPPMGFRTWNQVPILKCHWQHLSLFSLGIFVCVCKERNTRAAAVQQLHAMRHRATAQQRMAMRAKVHTTRLPVQQQPAATPVNHRAASCKAGRLMGARCACPHLAVWPQREQQHDGVHLPRHGRAHARRRAPYSLSNG